MSKTPLVRAGGVFAREDHHECAVEFIGGLVGEAPPKKERATLPRRTNYNYEKRQKELKRAKKKQQKLEEKRARKAAEPGEAAETGEGVEALFLPHRDIQGPEEGDRARTHL